MAAAEANLQGTVSIFAPVVAYGTFEAGTANFTGVLTINGTLTFSSAGIFAMRINGINPGTGTGSGGYDQVIVNGNVSLNGATLSVTVGYAPTAGNQFTILDLGSGDTRTGTFGTAVVNFSITYTGGNTSNDTVLTWIYVGGGGD